MFPIRPTVMKKTCWKQCVWETLVLARKCVENLNKTGQAGKLSTNPLRQEQIIFISFITQITRAAMDGGVPEDLAYAMSDSYIQTSEECTSLSQIEGLRKPGSERLCQRREA